jgi:pimeloyl-ACP methyl ester carboxylesterase
MDCRGHGLSGKPHDSIAYVGNLVADDVLAVMDAVGLQRVDIMGYSMGGRIAIDLLARVPERFTSVIAGGAGLRSALPDPESLTAGAEALEADDVSRITNPGQLALRQLAESRLTDPASIAGLNNDLKALAACTGIVKGITYDPVERIDALRRVETPVLAVVGDNDRILSEAQLLIQTVPSGELVVLPGEDHVSAVRSHLYKDAVASFLQAHAVRAA